VPLRHRNYLKLFNHVTSPPASPVHHRARSFSLIVMVFNISFFHFFMSTTSGIRFMLFLNPILLFDDSSFYWISHVVLSRMVVVHCAALARSSSAGGKRAHVAPPVSPARQGSSGRDRSHRAHGKVARLHEEVVSSPPRHRDDDDYTPSEGVGESSSASESERLIPGLTLACFVWFVLGGPLCFGSWALGLGTRGRGPLSFPRALF
jgi:hypothetical protein